MSITSSNSISNNISKIGYCRYCLIQFSRVATHELKCKEDNKFNYHSAYEIGDINKAYREYKRKGNVKNYLEDIQFIHDKYSIEIRTW